jgi:hypothetical protein
MFVRIIPFLMSGWCHFPVVHQDHFLHVVSRLLVMQQLSSSRQ